MVDLKRTVSIIATCVLATGLTASASPIGQLAGRYTETFDNGDIDGSEYRSTNVVEIYPLDRRRAMIQFELSFFNGHSCSVFGTAALDGHKLIFSDRDILPRTPACRLEIWRGSRSLHWEDHGTCQFHCGSRGGLSDGEIPLKGRRPMHRKPATPLP